MTIKMNEYTLPSGMAGFNVSDNEYTHPQSKRDISTALRESLHCNFKQQARIAELEETVIRLNDIIAKSTVGANSLGSRENTPNIDERQEVPMIITAGCYCTDIETEAQYIATCEALVRLGVPVGEYNKNSYTGEYASLKNVGWCLNDGAIYHSLYKSLQDSAPDEYIFTTLMPHRDIIKAAEDL